MSHYDVSYKNIQSRTERDSKAIQDIIDYIGKEKFRILEQITEDPKHSIGMLNMAMGFAGVSGMPFHAFCRRYPLAKYRIWMADDSFGDPIETDEQGFTIDIGEQ